MNRPPTSDLLAMLAAFDKAEDDKLARQIEHEERERLELLRHREIIREKCRRP